ncbi:YqaJ viral recombinase domain-containing protein [uncultured Gammaproteobacteria bacterium]
MKISVKDMADRHVASNRKHWSHDRLTTVGASETFLCARRTAYAKAETAPDPDYEDRYGARVRGDLIENHFWEPAIRGQKPEGVQLLFAGREQKTLVDGYLSATSDGLLVGVAPDALAHLGVPDLGSDTLVVECKSIDPRVSLKEAKAEHSGQTQVQMGLIRACTPYRPNFALISYADASFLDTITEFAVAFDPAVYAAAKDRARQIMLAEDPATLPPEGRIAGGSECRHCAFHHRCQGAVVGAIPRDSVPVGANALAHLKALPLNAQMGSTSRPMARPKPPAGAAKRSANRCGCCCANSAPARSRATAFRSPGSRSKAASPSTARPPNGLASISPGSNARAIPPNA